jgi:Polymorphic toxin system, DSP-PTPase phosphatase
VRPGALLAGEYPAHADPAWTRVRLERFRAAGVTAFFDLTEEGELEPYEELVAGWATHRRFPIRDFSCPSRGEMAAILDALDEALERDVVYVHCWGGSGRTGTVIGCWLVRHGLDCEEALARIADLRRETAYGERRSPESDEQWAMVRSWRR